MVTYMEPQTVPSSMFAKYAQQRLHLPIVMHAPHAQLFLSNISKWEFWRAGSLTQDDLNRTKFSPFPQKTKYQTYTLIDIHVNSNNILPTDKMNVMITLVGLPQRSQL